MKGIVGILILVVSLVPAWSKADMWTNAAGHGIEAKLVSLEKNMVTLQRGKGKPFKVKLSAFCATDQKRIRTHFGLKAVPRKPSATDLAYEKKLARLCELYTAGKMDEAEFDKQRTALLDHFYGKPPK